MCVYLVWFTGRSRNDPDGAELLLELSTGCCAGLTLLILPLGIYPWYTGNLKVYQHLINLLLIISPIPIPRILATAGMLMDLTAFTMLAFIPVFFVVSLIVMYVTTQAATVEQMRNLWFVISVQYLRTYKITKLLNQNILISRLKNTNSQNVKNLIGLNYRAIQHVHAWVLDDFGPRNSNSSSLRTGGARGLDRS